MESIYYQDFSVQLPSNVQDAGFGELHKTLNALLTTTPMISGVVSMDNDGFSSHIAQSAVIATALRELRLHTEDDGVHDSAQYRRLRECDPNA